MKKKKLFLLKLVFKAAINVAFFSINGPLSVSAIMYSYALHSRKIDKLTCQRMLSSAVLIAVSAWALPSSSGLLSRFALFSCLNIQAAMPLLPHMGTGHFIMAQIRFCKCTLSCAYVAQYTLLLAAKTPIGFFFVI